MNAMEELYNSRSYVVDETIYEDCHAQCKLITEDILIGSHLLKNHLKITGNTNFKNMLFQSKQHLQVSKYIEPLLMTPAPFTEDSISLHSSQQPCEVGYTMYTILSKAIETERW